MTRLLHDHNTDDADDNGGSCSLLIVAQKLDRVCEDATNIGKVVYFLCTGERYSRPSAIGFPAVERD